MPMQNNAENDNPEEDVEDEEPYEEEEEKYAKQRHTDVP